jgi:DNA-directed RNA polymerase subunit beta'
MTKSSLKQLLAQCSKEYDLSRTAALADEIKRLGFAHATKSGTSFAMSDVRVPTGKPKVLAGTDARIADLHELEAAGLITAEEQYQQVVTLWNEATERITTIVERELDPSGNVARISRSGATKASFAQIHQLCGKPSTGLG